jgi:Uncharacterized protein conserved in cyanobacteria
MRYGDREERPRLLELVRERTITYDEYAELPDDGYRYEIADGKLELMSPSPSGYHQLLSATLLQAVKQTCGKEYIILAAPLDVIFSQTDVRQPDLIIFHRSRKSIVTKRGIEGIPDVVAEILSPSTRIRDKRDKLKTYAKYGVPEYWIIDPATYTLEQYLLREPGYYELSELYESDEPVVSPSLPCLAITMNDIAAELKDVLGEQ